MCPTNFLRNNLNLIYIIAKVQQYTGVGQTLLKVGQTLLRVGQTLLRVGLRAA